MDLFITYAPVLLSAAELFVLVAMSLRHAAARVVAAALCIFLSARYFYWRITESLPLQQHGFGRLWMFVFLTFEAGAILSSMLTQFFMSRTIDRRPEADAHCNSLLTAAPVDVFIATYNEGYEILERTIVGARAIDHPDLRVWVLDDGARPWVRELAEELGAHYVFRLKGEHAKAGNVNHAFQRALTTGRRPEFLLLLDADFVPARNILKRVLGLFEDQSIGIVQTPQHFFNPDPLQSNLLCASVWPDEQRFFFNTLLPCKDAWGAAFCCGTSAIFRVVALEASGGMAVETVTEDMLTSFKVGEYGYRTVFLNERLSLGLAPEGLREYISQRARWCLGAMQQVHTRWSFLGRGRVDFIDRLSFFDTVLYWVTGAPFKLMVVSAPLVYWLTGASVMRASLEELLFWLGPALCANLLFLSLFSGSRVLPLITDVTQLTTSFVVCRTVAAGLTRPFGRPFKVTAKGLSTSEVTIHWDLLLPFLGLAAATIVAMFIHTARFDSFHGRSGFEMNILWSLLNSLMLCLAALACVEPPRRRKNERFHSDVQVTVRLGDGTPLHCNLLDISLGGARLFRDGGWRGLVGDARLVLDGGRLELPLHLVRRDEHYLAVSFDADRETRRVLIRELFTGNYHNEVETISAPQVYLALARALAS
jgi:cellulose synthase (UDP-forming)